ncbi:hypothetical protein ACFX1Q_039763 [Malus domestica]
MAQRPRVLPMIRTRLNAGSGEAEGLRGHPTACLLNCFSELGLVINCQIRVLRLQKGHKCSLLGQLLSEVGWNHYDTVKELENKRKEMAELAYERKKLG